MTNLYIVGVKNDRTGKLRHEPAVFDNETEAREYAARANIPLRGHSLTLYRAEEVDTISKPWPELRRLTVPQRHAGLWRQIVQDARHMISIGTDRERPFALRLKGRMVMLTEGYAGGYDPKWTWMPELSKGAEPSIESGTVEPTENALSEMDIPFDLPRGIPIPISDPIRRAAKKASQDAVMNLISQDTYAVLKQFAENAEHPESVVFLIWSDGTQAMMERSIWENPDGRDDRALPIWLIADQGDNQSTCKTFWDNYL